LDIKLLPPLTLSEIRALRKMFVVKRKEGEGNRKLQNEKRRMRHYATSRKIAGSYPDEVIRFLN
jgi:hypothetical protein